MQTKKQPSNPERPQKAGSMTRLVGPACPRLARKWRDRGCELGQAAKIIAENDDVRCLIEDDDAMPVSVAILGMIYGVNDDQARAAVIHWLRRPNETIPSTGATE
jgi:hypothetical protein